RILFNAPCIIDNLLKDFRGVTHKSKLRNPNKTPTYSINHLFIYQPEKEVAFLRYPISTTTQEVF
ncbi:hypothetical protein, partial [Klebsiella pneumoniae]|uniref:hypothetical protein n=1 Tax=Klebsiella pneumoniae TaxID=573 RepID=UPI001953F23B